MVTYAAKIVDIVAIQLVKATSVAPELTSPHEIVPPEPRLNRPQLSPDQCSRIDLEKKWDVSLTK